MEPTEAQTRAERIDKQLADAGWQVAGRDFEEEYEVGSAGESVHGFADYLLPDSAGRPLAVVEAKRSARDVLAGKEQAKRYADAIEAADGERPVVFLANGNEIWFWDGYANPRKVTGFFTQEDLERRRFQRRSGRPLDQTTIDTSIVDRHYQHEAIRRAHERFTEGFRRGLWVMATGTGKTRTAAALMKTLIDAHWAQRVLFLVDRDELAKQALGTFREHIPNEPRQRLMSGQYDRSKRIFVATLQTMQDFHTEISPGAFDLVISDECHRSIYDKWTTIFHHFDSLLMGLTATPADYIDRNTFRFFNCDERTPTFSYEFDQAVEDGYLVPYRVWHTRTKFQVDGIHGKALSDEDRKKLEDEGIDPDDIDFAGTDLERKVTNEETLRLHVEEFVENSIKDPDGTLPGKSIIFAMSHAHAKRIYETFLELYPQWSGLAEIIDSHMEHPDETLKRFKTEDMPRIAISVDMLDAGVDVPTVVNLAFMKPTYSKIKFWQMIGRGTRIVNDGNEKPWCSAGTKDNFRILDYWANFEYFNLNPEGEEPSQSTPVPVRFFRVVTSVLREALNAGEQDLVDRTKKELCSLIDDLPMESSGVREEREMVERISQDVWWVRLDDPKFRLLIHNVAPLMRFLGGIDLKALGFAARCYDYLLADLQGDEEATGAAGERLRDDLIRLPVDHPDISKHRDAVTSAYQADWVGELDHVEVLKLRDQLAQFMKHRQRQASDIIRLDLEDVFKEQRWVTVGPEAKEFHVDAYRERVEARVRRLADEHPAFLKMATGEPLTDQDVAAIESELHQPELYVTEKSLKAAYAAPHGSLVALLRHALGVEELPSREEAVREAVRDFIDEIQQRTTLNSEQLLFLRLFERRLVDAGHVERGDLYQDPFTRLPVDPDEALPGDDLDALLNLAAEYRTPYDD